MTEYEVSGHPMPYLEEYQVEFYRKRIYGSVCGKTIAYRDDKEILDA